MREIIIHNLDEHNQIMNKTYLDFVLATYLKIRFRNQT